MKKKEHLPVFGIGPFLVAGMAIIAAVAIVVFYYVCKLGTLTLYENILIGKPDASREEVLAAAEKAQCGEFLNRLPKGIDTMAGDGASCIASVNVHDKESIIQQVEGLLSHIRDNSELYTLLLENSADGEFPYKLIEGTVGRIADMHEFMPESMWDYAEYCSLFVVSGSLSIIRKWLGSGMNESPRELAELILKIATGKIGFRI